MRQLPENAGAGSRRRRGMPGFSAVGSFFCLPIESWQDGIDESVLDELHQRLLGTHIGIVELSGHVDLGRDLLSG